MEGPSLLLASQQLAPFINQTIKEVSGNTKIGKERLINQKILDIFSWGKHLVFQFDSFALRVHFMLFGTFAAEIENQMVTGDYEKKSREPRLSLTCQIGHIDMYNCSLKFLELRDAKNSYDFSIDTLSSSWDERAALKKLQSMPDREIGDVLLDQTVFAGVGNIIKNEVLYLVEISPKRHINQISSKDLRKIIKTVRSYVFQFYEWRKQFVLRKHFQIYHKSQCLRCNGKVIRAKTGQSSRFSYFCPNCQT